MPPTHDVCRPFSRIAAAHLAMAAVFPLLLSLLAGCNQPTTASHGQPASRPAKRVHVAPARFQSWPQTVRVQGSLLADEDSVVGAKIAGRVESAQVDLGSPVKWGDPLVLLDRRELDLQVALAESQLRQASAAIGLRPEDDETELDFQNSPQVRLEQALVDEAAAAVDRARQLLPTRAISGGEYDTLVAQLKAAEARLASARNSVNELVATIGVRRTELALARQQAVDAAVLAPFDGIVAERRVSPGEYVQVGQPVVVLVRSDRLRFTAGVPETKAAPVRTGQKIEIRVAGQSQPLPAVVTRVSPVVVQTSRSVRIEADLDNPQLNLPAGLFAEADILVDPHAEALAVPSSAVSRFAGVQKVWLVEDGTARQQTVRTGREEQGRVELLAGVAPGALVVTDADEGYDGPVIAVQQPADESLHAKVPAGSADGGL